MVDVREGLRLQIRKHRDALSRLELRLRELDGAPGPAGASALPTGFHLTFYVIAGSLIGLLGSLASLVVNVLGSMLIEQDPLLFLRAYGTVFAGVDSLWTVDVSFFGLVIAVHFALGALAGAAFHVLVNVYFPDRTRLQVALGAAYGFLLWIVGSLAVIHWLQMSLYGQVYVFEIVPAWVALATNLVFGLTLGLAQPLERLVPHRLAVAS